MSSAPFIGNHLYPGEDGEWIHRFEKLQGPTDPAPGQPFNPPQYENWTNWNFTEALVVKPPLRRIRRTRIPTEYGPELFTAVVAVYGAPTAGTLSIAIERASTALAQGELELFAELWATDPFGLRRHVANLRWIVENSVDTEL